MGVSLRGNASTHFVNKSVITSIYLLPLSDVWNGPIISQDNLSKGFVALIVPGGLEDVVGEGYIVGIVDIAEPNT